jgi:vacuolar-type H+-ATPase subunit E/Vma4
MFSKMIYEKIDEEAQGLSDSFHAERQRQVGQLKKELEERKAKELDRAAKEARFSANSSSAEERSESRKKVMLLRESLIEKTVEDIKNRFMSFIETPGYNGFLGELAARVIQDLGSGSYVIYLTSADLEKHADSVKAAAASRPDCSFELRASAASIIGGLVVEDGGRQFMLDGSFSSLIEGSRHYTGLKVSEMLGEGGASVWEQDTEG